MSNKTLNKSLLIGNLGAAPTMRQSGRGVAIARFDVATKEMWRDRQSGELQESTDWHHVVFFARQAEVAGEYLDKGSRVYVEGRTQTRGWKDDDGNQRHITEVVGSELKMLDSPRQTKRSNGQDQKAAPPADDTPDDEEDAPPPTQVSRPAPPASGQTG